MPVGVGAISSRRIIGGLAVAGATWWSGRHLTSPAVRSWRPSRIPAGRYGPLHARVGGDGDVAVVLLHGLAASGRMWSATFDRLAWHHRLVVPDLLGFGGSLDEHLSSVHLDQHADALDGALAAAGCRDRRLVVMGHSFGALVGATWAARHGERVDHYVGLCPPLAADGHHDELAAAVGPMARWFGLDTATARRACALSCRHRAIAGLFGALAEPTLPVPVARNVSLHTWPAYRDAVRALTSADWEPTLTAVGARGARITLARATRDRLSSAEPTATLAASVGATVVTHPIADHRVPLIDPTWCYQLIDGTRPRPEPAG